MEFLMFQGDKEEILNMVGSTLNFGDLSDADIVMEVGSEDAKSCKKITEWFPEVTTIGINKDETLYFFLEEIPGNVRLCKADIEIRPSLSQWGGKVARIYSMNCFNFVQGRKVAFENVYHLLKPGGAAAIFFCLTYPLYDCLDQLMEIPRWQGYKPLPLAIKVPARCNTTCAQFRTLSEAVGFEVVECEIKERCYTYPSEEVYKKYIKNYLGELKDIPSDMHEEFRKDYMEIFDKINGRSSDGRPCQKYPLMNILLKKN